MSFRTFENCLIAVAIILALPQSLVAQGGGTRQSYRITPPLRVAARPGDGLLPRGVTVADPFKPRQAKDKPVTLGVQGYCVVSLRDQQRWLQGSPQVQAVLGGKVYLFSSVRARDIFLAAPHLYLPALDGDCLVSFAESGRRVAGQLECGLIHGKRIYLFADQNRLRAFQSAPDAYLNADVVDDGACVVTKITERRYAPGLPATVALVDGRRYYFASAYQRRIFEQNPAPFLVQPLRNPLAGAKLEVPALTDVLDIDSLDFGDQGRMLAKVPTSSFNMIKRSSEQKKPAQASDTEDADDNDDFMHTRAMSGYCPVTIRTQSTWRRGKIKFRHTFDGKLYFLAGSEERAAFQANPRLYAPVLSGDSVVALVADYERVAGSVFHAFIYEERLYLFVSEEERQTFRDNPEQFENADLAARGNCTVSRVDDKQEIVGAAEFETLYRGKRFRFISADYLQKFLANPKLYAEQ
jgi:YHS domain-containing protein